MIKTVLFDFGGVLARAGERGFITRMVADLCGRDPSTVFFSDLEPSLRGTADQESEFFTELNRRYNANITPQQFLDKCFELFEPSAEVYDMAAQIRRSGLQTGIFSNVFSLNAREIQKRGLYDGFDPLFLSCYERMVKPDPRLYQQVLQKLNRQPQEVLFIDDQQLFLDPAQSLGFHTVLAQNPQQIVADTLQKLRSQGVNI